MIVRLCRIVRPRRACDRCEAVRQAPLPSRPIERGGAGPGPPLIAHVLVGKYGHHLPLYRQSQIFERDGLDLERSILAGWVGQATRLLEPLAIAIGRHVRHGQAIFADDTPVRVLSPGPEARRRRAAYGLRPGRATVGKRNTTRGLVPADRGHKAERRGS